jgi:hypothetical protein
MEYVDRIYTSFPLCLHAVNFFAYKADEKGPLVAPCKTEDITNDDCRL